MPITLTLTTQETQGLLQLLGQLPTSSNAWPLMQKILEQANSQAATTGATQ